MKKSSALILGSTEAGTCAAEALARSSCMTGVAVRVSQSVGAAMDLLSAEDDICLMLIVWGRDDPAALPGLVADVQTRQRNSLMAVLVRAEQALPEAIAEELWARGVADRHFDQPIAECAAAAALALREAERQRLHGAIVAAPSRLAHTTSFRELAALALRILDEQGIARRGSLLCFKRNTHRPQLLAVLGTGIYDEADCTPVEDMADAEARDLIAHAWRSRSHVFSGTLAALYVGTPSRAHAALIVLALDAPLQPWRRYLLESFATAIAPAIEESQLGQQLLRTQRATISTLATLAEYKDSDTGEHVARVARITAEIASFIAQSGAVRGIDGAFLEHIGHASILHDIGKVAIPEKILLKPGALDAEERAIINSHVLLGHEILKKAAALATHGEARLFGLASEIARGHHERYDGKGYPDRLAGEAIPLSARIVAVVDVFDALISHRPYKQPWSTEQALELIRREAGHHFDPRVVEAFVAVHERKAAARFIQWSDAMSVGHDELDRDHRRLIGILNNLGINLELGHRNIVEFILDDLADYAQLHFEREERHLAAIDFPELERHRVIHENIAHRIEDAKWKYFQGFSAALEDELLNFLTAWLDRHILVEDMKYKNCFAMSEI